MRSDVCLILEGTYPYVAGGVSTWVQQILDAMPQHRFSLLYIGPKQDMPRELKYDLPSNVVELREVFVHDYPPIEMGTEPDRVLDPGEWEVLGGVLRAFATGQSAPLDKLLPVLEKLRDDDLFMRSLCHSLGMWETVRAMYGELAPSDASFLDYFWTFRFINIPALQLLRQELPRARVYHSASTGYAGLLGAKASIEHGAPFLLTEHGIYTRERRIELFNAEWIRDLSEGQSSLDLRRKTNFFKDWWVQFFLSLSRTAYDNAQQILTLFEANRQTQIRDGAPAKRMKIIPNGIDTASFLELPRRERSASDPFRIGFVGRIAAIKDLKSLIRAFDLLQRRGIDFEAELLGPMDEEEDYARECRELVQALGLGARVSFPGRVQVKEYLPCYDVLVLSSISEGLPFVILEANCAGIPVVSTEVGAVRDLLEGRGEEDRALGPSGLVVPVATPTAMAQALARLAQNPELARQMGETGRTRVRAYYDIVDVMHEYRDLYEWYFYTDRLSPRHRRRSVRRSKRVDSRRASSRRTSGVSGRIGRREG